MKTVVKLFILSFLCLQVSAQKQACIPSASHTSDVKIGESSVCVSAPNLSAARQAATDICRQRIIDDNGNTFKAYRGATFGCIGCPKGQIGCEMVLKSTKKIPGSNSYKATGSPSGTPDTLNPGNKIYCFTCPGGKWRIKFSCNACQDTVVHVIHKRDIENGQADVETQPLGLIKLMYPNPTAGELNVQFTSTMPYTPLDIVITNVIGQEVFRTSTGNLSSGEELVRLDLSAISQGIHILTIYDQGAVVDSKTFSMIK